MDSIPAWLRSLLMQQAEGWARHALTAVSGILVARGYANHDQASEIIAGLVAAAAVLWSMRQKVTAGRISTLKTQAFTDGVTQALAQLGQQFAAPTVTTAADLAPATRTPPQATDPVISSLSPVRPVLIGGNDLEPIT